MLRGSDTFISHRDLPPILQSRHLGYLWGFQILYSEQRSYLLRLERGALLTLESSVALSNPDIAVPQKVPNLQQAKPCGCRLHSE